MSIKKENTKESTSLTQKETSKKTSNTIGMKLFERLS